MSNNQKRSFKFYRENEREVMEALGLKPTNDEWFWVGDYLEGGDANA